MSMDRLDAMGPHDALVAAAVASMDHRREALVVCDRALRIVAANDRADALLRVGRGALLGRALREFVELPAAPATDHGLADALGAFESDGDFAPAHGPLRVACASGEPLHALARVFRVGAASDALLGVTLLDPGATDALARELDDALSLSAVIVRDMPVGVVLRSPTGAVLEANPAARSLLGLPRSQRLEAGPIDLPWRAVSSNGTHPASHDADMSHDGQESPERFAVRHGDGAVTWIEVASRPLGGTPAESVSVLMDVTRANALELRLTSALRRFETLSTLSTEAVLILDERLTITSMSSNAPRVLGLLEDSLLGRPLLECVPRSDREEGERALRELLRCEGARARWDLSLGAGPGGPRTFELRGINLLGDPSVEGIVINLRDIHEQRVAEAALRDANEQLERRLQQLGYDRVIDAAMSRVAELMQHCGTPYETHEVVWGSLPVLLPGFDAALYFEGEDGMEFAAHRPRDGASAFLQTDMCWALRTRRTHVSGHRAHLRCDHLNLDTSIAACLPLAMGGHAFGLLVVTPRATSQTLPDADDLDRLALRLSIACGNARGLSPPAG
jgi:PAS domain S-box-containing protein